MFSCIGGHQLHARIIIKRVVFDPFSKGDWAYWGPGQIKEFGREISKPHYRLHFCGEHTAIANRGMEGALESGERAFFEILDLG